MTARCKINKNLEAYFGIRKSNSDYTARKCVTTRIEDKRNAKREKLDRRAMREMKHHHECI